MTPPDPLTRLRAADPVTWLREQTGADAPPPAAVLARIVATPPAAPRPPRRRGRRLALAAVAAAAVIAALLVTLPSSTRVDLAARAYAATAPDDGIFHTEETSETISPHGAQGAPGQRDEIRMWQRGDRMRDVMDVIQIDERGRPLPDGKRWHYEHEQNGDRFRTLNPDGTVDSMRLGDPGWNQEEMQATFAFGRQTIVERFRARYAESKLRDAGETTFAGRRARAYEVIGPLQPKGARVPPADKQTFYVDAETALPLGSVMRIGQMRITHVVKKFVRLPPTRENLALLDAPAIDAGKPNRP